ncbi:Putrescine aminotransferase [Oceanibacterium hippocampi]|uniref:Putrescine aminotransferase n=2 Tax=Oceanibacterium hippocampi TaxID=745714 RepID=A0A1Y5TSZ7_9PROT|nr:Putrescine aminotransferase [Oceanibacterium hippocampi]
MFAYERDIAAVIGETIRNGAYAPPDWYWPEVRKFCDAYGALLVRDELPTGFGKMGWLFIHERFDVRPDITVIGKALGASVMPVAGIVVAAGLALPAGSNLGYFTHEKNPLSALVGRTTLEIIQDENLVLQARRLGNTGAVRLQELCEQYPFVREVRCEGLMFGIEFGGDDMDPVQVATIAEQVFRASVEEGVIPIFPSRSSLTLSAPLVIQESELEEALGGFQAAVRRVHQCWGG